MLAGCGNDALLCLRAVAGAWVQATTVNPAQHDARSCTLQHTYTRRHAGWLQP
jgi:hypothetical protein